jgi:hypothetical protein
VPPRSNALASLVHSRKSCYRDTVSDSSAYAGGLRQVADPTKKPCYPCIPQHPPDSCRGGPIHLLREIPAKHTIVLLRPTESCNPFFLRREIDLGVYLGKSIHQHAQHRDQRQAQDKKMVIMDPTLFFHVLGWRRRGLAPCCTTSMRWSSHGVLGVETILLGRENAPRPFSK